MNSETSKLIPDELREYYEFHEWRNAIAVLSGAFPKEWVDLLEVLADFRILRSDIGELGEKGGGKSKVAIRMDRMFRAKEWLPQEFDTSIVVKTLDNVQEIKSPTHEVDSFKGKVALELNGIIRPNFMTATSTIFVCYSSYVLPTLA